MISVKFLIAACIATTFLMLSSGCLLPYFSTAFAFLDINFATVGDFDCPGSNDPNSSANQWKTMHNIESRNAERVLLLGDYSYRTVGNIDCWDNFLDASALDLTRVKQTVGNHETDQSGKLADFVNTFKPYPPSTTQQYYSFNYQRETGGPKIHVLVMSTEQCWSTTCAQYNFVNNDLSTASKDSTIQWIFVIYHKVMYISPNTCSSSSCVGSSSLRSAYNPLFDKYGVDMVFQGHVHNYERSKLIAYSGGSNPTVLQSSSTTYTKSSLRAKGEIFATVGIGGVNFHSFSGKSSFIGFQRSNSDGFGVLDVTISNNGKTLTGRYIPNGGSVRDQFTITKTLTTSVSQLSATSVPIALNQSVSTNENMAKPINLAARDASNNSLQYSIVAGPAHGELAGKRPSVVYLPSVNYTGNDQFTFKANNGRAESNIATINITVNKAGPSTGPTILGNVSKALAENKPLKPLIDKGKPSSNQTETSRILKDLTKRLIPEKQAPLNQSQSLQNKPDLTKKLGPIKQTEPSVNATESNKILISPNEKIRIPSRPIANAGQDQITSSNSLVSLDATKSNDKDGRIVSYLWSQLRGPKVLLNHADTAKPLFQSPALDKDTILAFKLIVKDNNGLVASDTVGVKVLKEAQSLRQDNSSVRILPDNPPSENGFNMRNFT